MLRFIPTHRIGFRRVYATGKKREDGYSCQKGCDPRSCAPRWVLFHWKKCHDSSTPETMALVCNDNCWLKVCIVPRPSVRRRGKLVLINRHSGCDPSVRSWSAFAAPE